MIPAPFQYTRASSVAEALSLLKKHGEDAKFLAGGHSLIPAMKLRLNRPETLIDISRVKSMHGIRKDKNEIVIGAMVTHGELANSTVLAAEPGLEAIAQAASQIGDTQVRNVGTIGGSIAHADPAADWPAVLLATDAVIVVKRLADADTIRSRFIDASNFFKGFYTTDLQDGEIITEIRIPVPPANTKSEYSKFVQPASRFAIVGCAAMITKTDDNTSCKRARVAFTGVTDNPHRATAVEKALTGATLNAANVADAVSYTANGDGVHILSDNYASQEYRSHLARVYCKRAIQGATA
jgi:aerobic carbon-monoxide dehydrogenase medium subunit